MSTSTTSNSMFPFGNIFEILEDHLSHIISFISIVLVLALVSKCNDTGGSHAKSYVRRGVSARTGHVNSYNLNRASALAISDINRMNRRTDSMMKAIRANSNAMHENLSRISKMGNVTVGGWHKYDSMPSITTTRPMSKLPPGTGIDSTFYRMANRKANDINYRPIAPSNVLIPKLKKNGQEQNMKGVEAPEKTPSETPTGTSADAPTTE